MYRKISQELLNFLKISPTPFHAVAAMAQILQENGYAPLHENQKWNLTPGSGYFVTRNDSALIAFHIPDGGITGWRIMASHSDSPAFKIKENPEIVAQDHYVQLNVEGYGGMIQSSWLDRPLSVAGRVVIREPGGKSGPDSSDGMDGKGCRDVHDSSDGMADTGCRGVQDSSDGMADTGCRGVQDSSDGMADTGCRDVHVVQGSRSGLTTRLINIDRDLVLIPNLAIHMNREINKGYQYNPQKDLLPLYGDITARETFMKTIALAAGCEAEDILGHDLFLYNRQPASIWGASGEFISSGRLDDLQCAYASLQGFLSGTKQKYAAVCCVFDNEEVGSTSKQGAAGTFLRDTMERIAEALSMSREEYLMAMADSFLVSADNAHGVHPNHPEKADPTNRPYLNEGIVIKYNADQKYCTDAMSAAMFKSICMEAGVPYQTFTNRSDMAGGSTLGNISNTQVSLNAIDIGLPQLAMHSPYETAGIKDTAYLIQASAKLFA